MMYWLNGIEAQSGAAPSRELRLSRLSIFDSAVFIRITVLTDGRP
jgi:hypothetical protein